jgi:hypothetical protein
MLGRKLSYNLTFEESHAASLQAGFVGSVHAIMMTARCIGAVAALGACISRIALLQQRWCLASLFDDCRHSCIAVLV